MTDSMAEELFDSLGIKYEREPDWITEGQKPDFYCSSGSKFWCEVKTLGRLEDSDQLGHALGGLAGPRCEGILRDALRGRSARGAPLREKAPTVIVEASF